MKTYKVRVRICKYYVIDVEANDQRDATQKAFDVDYETILPAEDMLDVVDVVEQS